MMMMMMMMKECPNAYHRWSTRVFEMRVIEMSCPWLKNRDSKDFKKTMKYSQLKLELTSRYPVLGGCSREVEQNVKELVGDKCESIMHQMQKAILSSSLHIARMFKLSS